MKKEIKLKFLEQLFDFWVIGLLGAGIQLILLFSLTSYLSLNYLIAGIIAFIITTVYSFLSNRHFTFHSRKGFLVCEERFFIISFVCFIINTTLLYFLTSVFGIFYLLSQIFSGCVIFVSSFFMHKYWTFQK